MLLKIIIISLILMIVVIFARKRHNYEKLETPEMETIKKFLVKHKIYEKAIMESAITGESLIFVIERKVNEIVNPSDTIKYNSNKMDSQTRGNMKFKKKIQPAKSFNQGKQKYSYLNTIRK